MLEVATKQVRLKGRRGYSPSAYHRPGMRHEAPRDREYYPSPKKQRMDYNYYEPERRPLPKHLQRAPDPKPAPVVIEKRPVMFNEPPKNVLDYQPLPQRKPVQRPKVVPQPQPTKIIEKPPTKPVQPVKPVEKQPIKTVVKQPTKPVEKQQPIKAVEKQPIKPVEKQPMKAIEKQPMKQVPAKQPVKPAQTPQKLTPQAVQNNQDVKPVNKFQYIKKEEPTPGPCPEGHSQLSEIMSRALSQELQIIMDVIAKGLPTQIPTFEERYVVKQFRTVVGDDIKKALGLNVTKRLLDIHNPLYVKLQFSGKPEAGCLQPFIKKYNIGAFKRIEAPGDLFAARLDTVADFDALSAAKEVACGSAKVTVTPCYKFLGCPPMLHTIYGTYEPEKEKKPIESTVNSEELDKSTDSDKNKETPKSNKLAIKQEAVGSDANDIAIKQELSDTNDETDTETKTSSSIKINITIEAAPKNDGKANDNKVTKEIDKPIKEEKDIKVEEEKDIDDDLEEMNDSDIVSLMSGGIVLDECSGSDDENLI